MRKILSLFTLLFFLGIYGISSNSELMEKIDTIRFNLDFFSPDTKFGDLYVWSYCPKIKVPITKFNLKTFPTASTSTTNLYITCDSYIGLGKTCWFADSLNKDHFRNLYTLNYYWRGRERGLVQLNSRQKNILILEIVERKIRITFEDTASFWKNCNNLDFQYSDKHQTIEKKQGVIDMIFNKKINQNLEYNLFSNPLFRIFKEWKASMNLFFFNKGNSNIASRDGKYLFFKPTVDTTSVSSSFKKLDNKELQKIVKTINSIYVEYKKYGFDEVYLSIIPNPVTIIEPTMYEYNQLIPKIQGCKNLKMPFIDCYTPMKNSKQGLFLNSDSHWNSKGLQLWVDEVNKILATTKK